MPKSCLHAYAIRAGATHAYAPCGIVCVKVSIPCRRALVSACRRGTALRAYALRVCAIGARVCATRSNP